MEALFKSSNYIEFLKIVAVEQKSLGHTQASLAKIMGCQAAYFSQALNGKVDLVEENLIRLARHLSLNDLETEYLLNLLRQSKAGISILKDHLEKQNHQLKQRAQELESRLTSDKGPNEEELMAYYSSSWIPSVIHLATSCSDYQTVREIADRFKFDRELVQEHLQKLGRYKLVKFENERWTYSGASIHFAKGSVFEIQMQIARKLLSTQNVYFKKTSDLHYSVIFSSDAQTIQQLRSRILDFIAEAHKAIEPSASEDVYSFAVDLFKA